MESFRKLGLSEPLLKLLEKAGIKTPSEIQEKVISLVLQGKDVIGGSATGSGKTLAFGAGIIDNIEPGRRTQVLVLTPTRELAEQVGNVFIKYGSFKNLKVAIIYGGVGMERQVDDLQRAEIVVATPGRILDHLGRRTLDLSHVKTLVLDEADRMLDMGFVRDVEKIIKYCPKERQTLLFSATISNDIELLSDKYMKNPISIAVDAYVDPLKLKQIYYDVDSGMKFSLLVHLLKEEKTGLVMVFCNTRHNTDFVANNLRNLGIDALTIHGGLTQQRRTSIMEKFSHSNKVHVLICTDVAARGLDIKGVSHVYNYDIPKTDKDYIHRVGRTARAGKEGTAISILSDRDYENFRSVTKNESIVIEREKTPRVERVRMILTRNSPAMRGIWNNPEGIRKRPTPEPRRAYGESGLDNDDNDEEEGSSFGRRTRHRSSSGRRFGGGRGGGRRFEKRRNFDKGRIRSGGSQRRRY